MGVLRKVIQELLGHHPHVAKFYPAPQHEVAQMAGLPGIINHGLCTMAFISSKVMVLMPSGVNHLASASARFANSPETRYLETSDDGNY